MSTCIFCGNNMPTDIGPCPRCNNWNSYWFRKLQAPHQCGSFIIDKNHFEYGNHEYNYQDIKHIDYDTLKTTTILGFMPVWESETAVITVYHGGETVIKEKGKASFSIEKNMVNLYAVYKYLSEASFITRFNRYAESISANGYFSYDGSRFFADGQLETRNQQKLSLSDWTINNHGSFFQLTPRDPTVMDKIGQGLSNVPINAALWKKRFHGDLTIHTTIDKDVFYSLMLRIYNIKFPFNSALSK